MRTCRGSTPASEVRPRRGRRPAALVGVALALVAAACAGGEGRAPRDGAPRRAVLLVPGYLVAPSMLAPLRDALRRAGMRADIVALPRRGTASVLRSARVVARAVREAGSRPVDLVGFSSGGIVVRAYLRLLGGAARTRTAVLLGAPNHGARVADVAASLDPALCAGACRQLRPGSRLLARLNAGDETPGRVLYVSIWTETDAIVTPPRSARLAGAWDESVQAVCPRARLGHADLVTDPRAVGLVVLALRGRLAEAVPCRRARTAGRGAPGTSGV